MDELTVQSALDVAYLKKLPQVESYYDKVHQRSYAERWGGYVSGMIYGVVGGAIIGAIAVFIPTILGAPVPTLSMIGQSAALFGSLGTVVGTTICTQVGSAAGAVAAGFEEHERREKLEKIREKNPELAAKIDRAIVAKAEAERPKNTWDRIGKALKRSFDWPLAGVGLIAGLAFGAIFSVTPMTSFAIEEVKHLFPVLESETLRFVTLTLMGGVIGAAFVGFMGSVTSNVLGNATRPIFDGRIFEGKTKERTPELNIESEMPTKKFAPQKDANISFSQNIAENRLSAPSDGISV